MPALSGTQKARMFALGGVLRFGAGRFGYQTGQPMVSLGGVWIAAGRPSAGVGGVLVDTLTITDALDERPNTCAFTTYKVKPAPGQPVVVTIGSRQTSRLFAGHVLSVEQGYAGRPAHVVYRVSCIDATWRLGRRAVTTRYTNQSATDIALDLLAAYATGVTSAHVAPNLPTVDEITFTNEPLPGALSRLVARIGGYWYLDYDRDVHVFLTETDTTPTPLTAAHPSLGEVSYTEDLSQIVTRVYVEGRGTQVTEDVLAGATVLPVLDASPFVAGVNTVVAIDAQVITFAGITMERSSPIVDRPTQTATPLLVLSTNGVGHATAIIKVRVSFRWDDGTESPASVESAPLSCTTNNGWTLTNLAIGPPGVTARRVYVDQDGNGYAYFSLVPENTSTSLFSAAGFGGFIAGTLPTAGGTYRGGATRIFVADTTPFNVAGGTASGDDGESLTYTGVSGGALVGIPADGVGRISGTFETGETLVSSRASLVGIPAAGPGSIRTALKAGTDLYLRVRVDDTPAQAALAALIGGGDDGIQEEYVQDRRLSYTEAVAVGTALLAQKSAPDQTLRYQCRDPRTKAGRTITLAIGPPTSLYAVLKIQQVTIDRFQTGAVAVLPTFTAEASSSRYTFEDLLRQARGTG